MVLLRTCRWTEGIARFDADQFDRKRQCEIDLVPHERKRVAGAGKGTWGLGLTTTTLSPDERLDALLNALKHFDELGYKRSAHQKLFHKAFVVAALKHIFGSDIHRHVGRLMRKMDVDEIRPDVIIHAIRRAGKTFAVAMFAAALVTTQPGIEVNIYSTAKRASRKLQALIWKMVVLLSGTESVIQAYNQEELIVTCGHTTSKVNSLPGSVEIRFTLSPPPLFFYSYSASLPRHTYYTVW